MPEIGDLGPLAGLVGVWEGDKGDDIAPDDDPKKVENNKYRERAKFEFIGQVDNHAQKLFGLRYSMTAWRIGEDDSFHEELGYWLWDAKNKQVMRCFMIPRGVTILAGGTVEPTSKIIKLAAELGSPTYGICSNQFLDKQFKTLRYDLNLTLIDSKTISYDEDTQLQIAGQSKVFHHTDRNTLRLVQSL